MSKAKFRKAAVDYIFSGSDKLLRVSSPPKFYWYVVFALVAFTIFVASLFIIRIPISVQASGFVVSGERHFQITSPSNNQTVEKVHVVEGTLVSTSTPLLTLKDRNILRTQNELDAIDERLSQLQKQSELSFEEFTANENRLINTKIAIEEIVKNLNKNKIDESAILLRYQENADNGLISQQEVDVQNRRINDIVTQISQASLRLINTKADIDAQSIQYDVLSSELNASIANLKRQRQLLLNGEIITSPCDCTVDKIHTFEEMPVQANKSMMSLLQTQSGTRVQLFIPSTSYRPLSKGSELTFSLRSFPRAKYGSIRAEIVNVSSTPVPANMLDASNLPPGDYFIATASADVDELNFKVTTGMEIHSQIITDNLTLASIVFASFSGKHQ
jgi:hypothetical protein